MATVPALACSANTLRFADLPTRAAAAAAAGFRGLGLRVSDYLDTPLDDAAIVDLLDGHGLRILELEHTWDWATGPDPVEKVMFRFADRIGVRHLVVPMFAGHLHDELVAPFGRLCDRAADHGLTVGLEFLPYSRVRTLEEAWRIVADADRPGGGVVLDLWHWFRSGATPGDLEPIPADRFVGIQLNDVLPVPLDDATTEARHHRRLPGRGAGDTPGLLSALREHGVGVPASVEVFSDELDALPAGDAARRAFQAGSSVLAGSRLQVDALWAL